MLNAALLLLAAAMAPGPSPWTLAAEADGVRVEHREEEGSLQSFRAEGWIDAPPTACLAALRSEDFFSRTTPHVAEAREIGMDGPRLRWFYARIDPPFVAARDYTLRVEEESLPSSDGEILRLSWRSDESRGPPPRPGTVRVVHSEGAWTFQPVDGGASTRVHYEIRTDPGGSIPRWIARLVQVTAVLRAFEEIRRATRPSPSTPTSDR